MEDANEKSMVLTTVLILMTPLGNRQGRKEFKNRNKY